MDTNELNSWFRKTLKYKGPSVNKLDVEVDGFNFSIVSDPPMNRIRVQAEICDTKDVDLKLVLRANYHSTQDVHYSIHLGKVYGLFTHWLKELTEFELDKAYNQILELAKNTLMGVYWSGDMVLSPAIEEAEEEELTEDKPKMVLSPAFEKTEDKKITDDELMNSWADCCNESDQHLKGRLLEGFVKSFLSRESGFKRINTLRTENEEFDLLIVNDVESPHWQNYHSPFILLECKNTRDKIPISDVRNFFWKIENHSNACKLGFLVSVGGFTKGSIDELMRLGSREFVVGLIDGDDINEFFEEPIPVTDFLIHSLINSIK